MRSNHIHKGCGGKLWHDRGTLFCTRCPLIKKDHVRGQHMCYSPPIAVSTGQDPDGSLFAGFLLAEGLIEAVLDASQYHGHYPGPDKPEFEGFSGGISGGAGAEATYDSPSDSSSSSDSSDSSSGSDS